MMIMPESYYNEFKGRSVEEIWKEIRSMKRSINYLKKSLGNEAKGMKVDGSPLDPISERIFICPSDDTILKMEYEYLKVAKRALKEAGGEYVPSKKEIREKELAYKLSTASEIRLIITKKCYGDENYTVIVGKKMVKVRTDNLMKNGKPYFSKTDKDYFFEKFSRLHIEEWKRRYHSEVKYFEPWKLTFKIDDGKDITFVGSGDRPYNFHDLVSLLDEVIDYD